MHPNNSRYTKSAHRTTLTSYTNNNTAEHTTHNGEGTKRSGALGQMKWNRKLFATARKQINTWSFSCAFAFAARNYAVAVVVVHFSMPSCRYSLESLRKSKIIESLEQTARDEYFEGRRALVARLRTKPIQLNASCLRTKKFELHRNIENTAHFRVCLLPFRRSAGS